MEFGTSVGTQNDAGLPNITGGLVGLQRSHYERQDSSGTSITGAFADTEKAVGYTYYVSTNSVNVVNADFNASRSNSIYGSSTTVQPKSLVVTAIIKY